jgi:hypothetical protein
MLDCPSGQVTADGAARAQAWRYATDRFVQQATKHASLVRRGLWQSLYDSPDPFRNCRVARLQNASPTTDDEKLYRPRIHSRWIRELYQIKIETGELMTVLLEQALADYVQRRKELNHCDPNQTPDDDSIGRGNCHP